MTPEQTLLAVVGGVALLLGAFGGPILSHRLQRRREKARAAVSPPQRQSNPAQKEERWNDPGAVIGYGCAFLVASGLIYWIFFY